MPADSRELQHNTYVLGSESGAEMARLMSQEQLITKGMGGLFPERPDLSAVHDILDVACGPGGWALDVAYEYPDKRVTGVDISERMVAYAQGQAYSRRLENADFRVMNILHPLTFDDASFDVVNARLIFSFMPKDAWHPFLRECLRLLRPGGTIRLTEPERTVSSSPALQQLDELGARAFHRVGQSVSSDPVFYGITVYQAAWLQRLGCTAVGSMAHITDFSSGFENHAATVEIYKVLLWEMLPFLRKLELASKEALEQLYYAALREMVDPEFCGAGFYRTTWGGVVEPS